LGTKKGGAPGKAHGAKNKKKLKNGSKKKNQRGVRRGQSKKKKKPRGW